MNCSGEGLHRCPSVLRFLMTMYDVLEGAHFFAATTLSACYVHTFGEEHYDAQSRLHDSGEITRGPIPEERCVHSPRHDAESVFWVTTHSLVTAHPRNSPIDDPEDELLMAQRVCEFIESSPISFPDERGYVFMIVPTILERCLHPELRSVASFMSALTDPMSPI
ncbi:hypothetical protein AURDEDRAFT_159002 [Auricularia subglabra TFB-10046 SS5]|nr:hypothetical protein AURDEDRAFT_159002 [Auricularia subglabra TFB-10046 SS5]